MSDELDTYLYTESSDPRSAYFEYLQVLALCSPCTDLRSATILDAGCGMNWLRDLLGPYRVIGIDIALNSRADIVADASMLPLRSKSVDVALCIEVLEHMPRDKAVRALRELVRVARRCVAVSCPNRLASGMKDPRHLWEPTLLQLLEMLRSVAGFICAFTCHGTGGRGPLARLPRRLRLLMLPVAGEWCAVSACIGGER